MRVTLPELPGAGYEVYEWRHASAILRSDFPDEWKDVMNILKSFKVKRSHIMVGGGGKTKLAQEIDSEFKSRGWTEKQFLTEIKVDAKVHETPTHKVDCVKGRVALELEWSNKDPFFDRDLNNFRLLFDLRAISVGIIITKGEDL
ncbi:MAG: hypothetical protein JNM34_09275 [Chthonomonadaceae bacterium]|nr:hypothetical protein [Chthonomonadaceae bacterium]